MKKNFILFVIVEAFVLRGFVDGCFATSKHHVHILSNLPRNSAPFKIRCQSRDTDLGYHTLAPNQKFEWEFCNNFFGNTKYFCHFTWGSNDKTFDVFDEKVFGWSNHDSWWVAKSDGVYFDTHQEPTQLTKKFDW